MDQYIAHANIDHYINLLNSSHLAPHNRSTITKLLIEEENKLGRDLKHLEFAETRAAKCQDLVNHFRRLRDGFADGSNDRAQAESLLANSEAIHELVERFCRHMRERINSRGL